MRYALITKPSKRTIVDWALFLIGAVLVIFAVLFPKMGFAQDAPKRMTVEQVVYLSDALSKLDRYDAVCKDGGSEKACQKLYNFGPGARWTISLDLAEAKRISAAYYLARNALVAQYADGGNKVPDDKFQKFQADDRLILDKPADVSFGMLRRDDLKLDENPIPPSVLAALVPIIEQK
jgi:hypothetical protein